MKRAICNYASLTYFLVNILLLLVLSIVFNSYSIIGLGILFSLIPIVCIIRSRSIKKEAFRATILLIVISSLLVFFTLLVYLFFNGKYGNPYYNGGSDDYYFEESATKLIENKVFLWSGATRFEWFNSSNSRGYIFFLSYLIRLANLLGGYSTFVPRLLNIYLVIACSVLVTDVLNLNGKWQLISVCLISLFPNTVFISSFVFRDAICAFFICFVLWIWRKPSIKQKKTVFVAAVLTAVIIFLAYFVRAIISIFCLFILFAEIFFLFDIPSNTRKKAVLLFGLFCIPILYRFFGDKVSYYIDYYSSLLTNSSKGLTSTIFSVSFFPFGFVLRLCLLAISPTPGALFYFSSEYSPFDYAVSLGTIVQIYLLFYFWKGIIKGKRECWYALLIMSAVTVSFTFRHFILFYPFLLGASIEQMSTTEKKVNKIVLLSTSLLIFLGAIAYISIKLAVR